MTVANQLFVVLAVLLAVACIVQNVDAGYGGVRYGKKWHDHHQWYWYDDDDDDGISPAASPIESPSAMSPASPFMWLYDIPTKRPSRHPTKKPTRMRRKRTKKPTKKRKRPTNPPRRKRTKRPSRGKMTKVPTMGKRTKPPRPTHKKTMMPTRRRRTRPPTVGKRTKKPSRGRRTRPPTVGKRTKKPSRRERTRLPTMGRTKRPTRGKQTAMPTMKESGSKAPTLAPVKTTSDPTPAPVSSVVVSRDTTPSGWPSVSIMPSSDPTSNLKPITSSPTTAVPTAASIVMLTSEELNQGIQSGRFDVVVDVRSLDEWETGHIEGATLVESLNQFGTTSQIGTPEDLKGCESCTIVVYCRSGARAMVAAQILIDAGFKGPMYNGLGVSQWTDAGLSLVNTSSVVPSCVSPDNGQCSPPAVSSPQSKISSPTGAPGGRVVQTEISTVSTNTTVMYDVVFTNKWSAQAHPFEYPGEDAHWSPPIIASHSSNYQMWEIGSLASPGVVVVAETGAPGTLEGELAAAGTDIGNFVVGVVMFNSVDQSQDIGPISVDPSHPVLSSISMVAPSPDWFSGFYDFVPSENGLYYKSFTIETFPMDGGSDSGVTYTSEDVKTDPAGSISEFTVETSNPTYPVFLSSDGSSLEPLLSWRFSLREEASSMVGDGVPSGMPSLSNMPSSNPSGPPVSVASGPVTSVPSVGASVPASVTEIQTPSNPPSVSNMPSSNPTTAPVVKTAASGTGAPAKTSAPSKFPSVSNMPSTNPTAAPVLETSAPGTGAPMQIQTPSKAPSVSSMPSSNPTAMPVVETAAPATGAPVVMETSSISPSVSNMPSTNPTMAPALMTSAPVVAPSGTMAPTQRPTRRPTKYPTLAPS